MSSKPWITKQFHLLLIGCVLAVLLLPGLALPGDVRSAHAVATKIMPLGDSITGSTCWRAKLWNRLQTNGYTNIDFVGTLNTTGCGQTYDGDNEGHGGYLVAGVANENLLPPWLSATNPDIVLMHFGTNDVWNQVSTTNILAAYSTLVDQMRANNPNMKIIVAQIIPMDPSGCATCYQGVIDLNNAIPGWASGKSTPQSPIYVVDQWTGFDVAADTVDRVHPNDTTGSQKMSDKWYTALTPLLSGGTPAPTSTKTNTPPPPTATPVGTVTVDDSVQGTGQNQFNYVGAGWSHCTACDEGGAAIFYNASQSWDITTNDSVTIAFTGTQIKYYAVKAPDVGIAAVSIDGGAETNVDLYMTPKTGNVLVWTSATLSAGSHTFKVRNTGTKNASSAGTTITLDRVDILSGPTPTPGPSSTPTNTPPPASGFVTRSGTHLMLNGSAFYFGGANNYYMLTVPTNEVDSVMNNAHAHGLNVLRVWGYLEGNQGDAHVLQYFTSGHPSYNDGANGFGMMDYMIYKAGQAGVRLIITLTNNWAAYGGMDTYVAWRGGGTTHDSFYSDATLIQWYKDYIAHVLNRVNSLNGIAYKNDPTIMAWELANEPRCNGGVSCDATTTAWANTISTYIKSIDPNHLVGSGSEGFFSGGTGNGLPAWLYDGSQGIDEKAMTRLANIDYQSLHLYPDYWGITTAQGTTWITDHVNDSKNAGKAVIVGEFGWKNLSQRQSVYDSWTNAILNNDGAGWLFWVLFGPEETDTEGFTIYCNTTNTDCTTVSNEAALMNAKNGSPTATPTRTNTPVATNTPTNTPVATNTPTNTPVATNTPTNTPVATNTPTNTPVATNTPTPTPTSGASTITVDDSVQGTGQNQFNFAGAGWSHCTNCNEGGAAIFYNASQSWDITTNDSVTIAFTGTQIKYYAVKAPDVGIAAVSIDGGAETNVDLYMTPKTGNVLIWTSATLSAGSHTFKVRTTGTKNASSTGTTITLDRVDITTSSATATPTPTPTNTPVPGTPTPTPTPSGVNLAAGKVPTCSTTIGSPAFVTDGDKNTANYANIPENPQWIQLDLGQSYNLTQIKLWHYFGDGRTYHDVIVQVSNVADFSTKTTVFNNDTNNSAGQGTGSQAEYAETSTGKVISFAATSARYVRLWSNGSTANIYNHYVEVEVY